MVAPDRARGARRLRQFSNSAKQVAPDPDIRANLLPFAALRTARTSTMTGAILQAASSRSFRVFFSRPNRLAASADLATTGWGAAPMLWPACNPIRENTARVSTATPGLTRTAKMGPGIRGSPSRSPRPLIIRARGSRQTGTSAPVGHVPHRPPAHRRSRGHYGPPGAAAPPRHRTSRRRCPMRPAGVS